MASRSSGVASSRTMPNINGSCDGGHLGRSVLAELVPLRLGDRPGRDGQDVRLLVVEVLEQGDPQPVEGRCDLLRDGRPRLGHPAGESGAEPVHELLDHVVLALHPVDQLRVGRVPFEELRPQQLVLAGVVQVQALQDEPGVAGDHGRTSGVAGRDGADEARDDRELTSERAVDDDHVVDIGQGGGVGAGLLRCHASTVTVREPSRHPQSPPHPVPGQLWVRRGCRVAGRAVVRRRTLGPHPTSKEFP